MRSKTSCFNGTLLRKDLGRFWPLWCAYLAVWLVAVPLNQFLTLFGTSIRYYTPIQLVDVAVSNLLDMGTEFGMWMGLISGCFFAMALFSYLCSARSVGMMHSFPIRREGLFFTHYLAGCIVFLSSLVITGLLTAAVQGVPPGCWSGATSDCFSSARQGRCCSSTPLRCSAPCLQARSWRCRCFTRR